MNLHYGMTTKRYVNEEFKKTGSFKYVVNPDDLNETIKISKLSPDELSKEWLKNQVNIDLEDIEFHDTNTNDEGIPVFSPKFIHKGDA